MMPMSPKRVALISFHSCPLAPLGEKDAGGMNVYVLQLARQLGSRGISVDVYVRSHDAGDPQIIAAGDNVRVVHIEAGPYSEAKGSLHRHLPMFKKRLNRFKEREGLEYDLIHGNYWLSGDVGVALASSWGVPLVVTFHTLGAVKKLARAGEKESQQRIRTEKRVMAGAEAIIAFTPHERDLMVRLYGAQAQKIAVIPCGVDLGLFHPLGKKEARQALGLNGEHVLLYVGRIEPIKGLDILFRAVAELRTERALKVLVVGGDPHGDEEVGRLKDLARDLAMDHTVSFLGAKKQEELPLYYSAADVLVMPSYYESFGLVALEAMACGTPVLAARVGGLPGVVRDGETGYLVPWHCPEPFSERLETLLGSETLRQAMGQASQEVTRLRSWGGVAQQVIELYRQLT